MEELIFKLNNAIQKPTLEAFLNIFEHDGYVRLNMVYISPISLKHLRQKLESFDLIEMFFTTNGLAFIFKTFRLNFFGNMNVVVKNKIYCIEINFDPTIDENCGIPIMSEIEHYLKGCDALFFMTYFVDIDMEILHNSLSESVDFLYKRSVIRK
ncbi:hypothetical protein NBO_76g0018 [Nosema bombycis CQ1]|uniref:Uncharacterized protein n=1 Tax=Nosema bombycis (strain CQ1 / CVCC 102059) TaxID=578461 RepID=R0MKW2_NOSB1|nr:hypothetical protein NBO_76g0018 [Nosema bombycis CQ1]|eukprot:EOB13413.1 hypothetical protein NBO_76g0018 [Nosema bombycis CQ1]